MEKLTGKNARTDIALKMLCHTQLINYKSDSGQL